VLGKGWVQGKSSRAVLQLTRHLARNQLGTHIFSGGAKIFEVESRPQVTGLLATSAVFTAKVTV